MKTSEAVKCRIFELLKENNMSINSVCMKGGMTTSTLNTMLNNKSEYCSVRTLVKFCQGIGISIRQFFDDKIFENNDIEFD